MEIAHIPIRFNSRLQTFKLYFVGDVHLGSAHCDESKFDATLKEIEHDENARVILMGDLCEYIPRGEWRWREENIAEWVDQDNVGESERAEMVKRLTPIRAKVIGAIQGNHELELADTWNQAVHKKLCADLQIRNLGYSALVNLQFEWKRKGGVEYRTLTAMIHHGWGGGISDGADLGRFAQLALGYDADWYIAGHTHRKFASKSVQYRLSHHKTLQPRVRLYGRSGTFLKTVSVGKMNYAEIKAMRPLDTGALKVVYQPSGEDFTAEV